MITDGTRTLLPRHLSLPAVLPARLLLRLRMVRRLFPSFVLKNVVPCPPVMSLTAFISGAIYSAHCPFCVSALSSLRSSPRVSSRSSCILFDRCELRLPPPRTPVRIPPVTIITHDGEESRHEHESRHTSPQQHRVPVKCRSGALSCNMAGGEDMTGRKVIAARLQGKSRFAPPRSVSKSWEEIGIFGPMALRSSNVDCFCLT